MHKIQIAVDHHEGAEFCQYLNQQGHDAAIGTSTGNFVDGYWTSVDENAREILNSLWDNYCN